MSVNFQTARAKAREIHFGKYEDGTKAPGRHVADSMVEGLLFDSLTATGSATRAGRSAALQARKYWDPKADTQLADAATKSFDGLGVEDLEDMDMDLASAVRGGVVAMDDQYTAERVRNLKTEVLSRFVSGLIAPQTTITKNFFRTIQADAGESLGQLREFVTYVETLSDWTYHMIDPNRGDIKSIEVNIAQYAERVTTYMQMYGAKVEYENYLYRVLPNVSVAEVFAMLSVGWAKASAMQREYDASMFLTNYLAPAVAFDNNGGPSALGQMTGVGVKGIQNGSFNPDYDFPRLLDYMQGELNMGTDNVTMLLPRNAWAFINRKRGYSQFLGTDGTPLYQRPNIQGGARPQMMPADRYGIQNKGAGFQSAAAAANYVRGTREHAGATAQEALLPGVHPFLPEGMPNMLNEFSLPNAAFPGMKVVLTPFAQANHRFYADGSELRNDDQTGRPRPVLTTDILLFDANHPLYLIETIPPTSWTAYNEEYRKSTVVMVEAYAMANSARGQQACLLKGAVIDHHYDIGDRIRFGKEDIQITDVPLGEGGMQTK